jgi:Penicillin binding protein transpeptidase domain/NTF2-like N-terminal transpeptidase domain
VRPAWKRAVLITGALAVVTIVTAAVITLRGGSGEAERAAATPQDLSALATGFLNAWSWGDVDKASSLADDPASAAPALKEVRRNLAGDPQTTLLGLTGTAASFRVTWTFERGLTWTYLSNLTLVEYRDKWVVHWAPTVIHPQLATGKQLVLRGHGSGNAVLDRDGKPLLTWEQDQPKAVDDALAPLLLPALGRVAVERTGKDQSVVLTDGTTDQVLLGADQASSVLTSSLSSQTQLSAQAAVNSSEYPAMLVAIQPSTGDILAVAQNSAAGADPGALTGLYAPGSTFKIVTAAAVLAQGSAAADTVLPCPGSAQIGQRTIPNDDGFSFAPLPLHSAFAHSCNTTFAQLAAGLPADALSDAASRFGLNADFSIPGITTEAGKVEPTTSAAEQVESAIGQGTVQASPFGLALMAATVASGKAVTPTLWHGLETTVNTGYEPPPGPVITSLRSMMREVVTSGTATGLQGSGQVFGKTGTAQFGDGSQANGWFAGYRGDVAFAVLLLRANSSKPAVSVSAAFLR